MKKILHVPVFFTLILLLAGCSGSSDDTSDDDFFQDPNVEPIKATVRTAVPLAYAASVAMEAVKGTSIPNVLVSNTCSSFPCVATVTITVDDQTFPLQFSSYGQILVFGLWNSPNDAILTVLFDDMFAGSSIYRVHDVSIFPVTSTASDLKIVYANIDVNIATGPVYPDDLSPAEINAAFLRLTIEPSADPAVNVAMDAWIVDAGHADTPTDFSDDSYTINGGGQYINVSSSSDSILQLGMAGTIMAPECALNPVDGLAVINEVATSSGLPVVATAILSFEPSCDGTAKVLLATGNYLLSIGKSIPLHLNDP